VKLSERRKSIIEDVGRFRILPSTILHRRHLSHTSSRVALNEFNRLVEKGLLTKRRAYPKVGADIKGPPLACYLWLPKNQRVTRELLSAQGEAHVWQRRFLPLVGRYANTEEFSPLTFAHEIGLSRVFDWLEEAVKVEGWTLVFWERYKNRDERVMGEWPVTHEGKTVKRKFNPDGFFGVRAPGGQYYFRFVELDNDTAKPGEYEAKLAGYIEAYRQKHFDKIIARVCTEYAIPIHDVSDVQVPVLNVAVNEHRRNDLLRESEPLDVKKNFLFATLDDLQPGTGFTNIWLRGEEFFPLYAHAEFPKAASEIAQIDWLDTQIADVEKVKRVSIISN
jgi:hypothetical protein